MKNKPVPEAASDVIKKKEEKDMRKPTEPANPPSSTARSSEQAQGYEGYRKQKHKGNPCGCYVFGGSHLAKYCPCVRQEAKEKGVGDPPSSQQSIILQRMFPLRNSKVRWWRLRKIGKPHDGMLLRLL